MEMVRPSGWCWRSQAQWSELESEVQSEAGAGLGTEQQQEQAGAGLEAEQRQEQDWEQGWSRLRPGNSVATVRLESIPSPGVMLSRSSCCSSCGLGVPGPVLHLWVVWSLSQERLIPYITLTIAELPLCNNLYLPKLLEVKAKSFVRQVSFQRSIYTQVLKTSQRNF